MSNLFNPFRYVAGYKSLAWGVVFIVATSLMLWSGGMIQDGYVHYAPYVASYWKTLYAEVVFWLLPSLLLMLCGWVLTSSKIRVVDIFGTIAFSHLATIPMVAIMVMPKIQAMLNGLLLSVQSGNMPNNDDKGIIVVLGIVMLLCLALFYIWSYKAYSVSCNVRGWRAVTTFIAVQILCTLFGSLLLLPLV